MSHDSIVLWALKGSFKKKERRTGKEKGRCRKVGGLKKRKDVGWQFCSLGLCDSGLTKTKDVIIVTLCKFWNVMDMDLCSVGLAFGHWPGTVNLTSVKEKKKHHLCLWAALCFMCRPSVCQCASCLHMRFYSHILDVANQHQTLRKRTWTTTPWSTTHICPYSCDCQAATPQIFNTRFPPF